MSIIIILVVLLMIFLGGEYYLHQKNLNSIPIRIHINGTRGKSSVTRLIAAAIRENGLRVFAKTTGTLPKMILNDGQEYPIYRPSKANIIEQVRIVGFAAANQAEVLVIECMALQPRLQSLAELKLVKATHGIITNARPDHLDVMGPEEHNVAQALLGTTPKGTILYTAERDYREMFQDACDDRGSKLCIIEESDVDGVTDEEMDQFSYLEHKENVALALKVCGDLNLCREKSLQGMYRTQPDSGAMTDYRVTFFGRSFNFTNGFAANDPESSERIWQMACERYPDIKQKIMIINCRADRADRTRQIAQSVVEWTPAESYMLIGSGTYIFTRAAVKNGLDPHKVISCEGQPVEKIFEEIIALIHKDAMVMGLGNIAGPGLELVSYCRNRSIPEEQEGR